MSSLPSTIHIHTPLNSLTISGVPNPDGIPPTATITVTGAGDITNGHILRIKDGYGESTAYTFVTADDDCGGRDIGVSTAQGADDDNAAATQIALSINTENTANKTNVSAVAEGAVITLTSGVTWSNNSGNETNSTSDGSGGEAAGVTITDFNFGREARTSLKLNHTELLGVGESSYIQEMREGILKARTGMGSSTTPLNFRVPESWDLEWNYRLGPIWTPASASGTDDIVKCWLTSHDFDVASDNNRGEIQTLLDQSTEGNDFVQGISGDRPSANGPDSDLNNFRGISFDGTNDVLFCQAATYANDFDVGATDDFGIYFVIHTGVDRNQTECLLQIIRDATDGTFNLSMDQSSTNKTLTVHTRDSGTDYNKSFTNAFTHSTTHIIFVGRVGGTDTVRVDGTTLSGSADAIKAIDGGAKDATLGCAFGVGGGAAESNYFSGTFYEFLFVVEGSGDFTKVSTKYEGYLAWKYNTVASLAADHQYKSQPPRATICL